MGGEETAELLIAAALRLSDSCAELKPGIIASTAVAHATNPIDYAWAPYRAYLRKSAGRGAKTILLGMNPGPWGMAQTGVPFGATGVVRDIIGISGYEVTQPEDAHPNRPVEGLMLARQEVSGTRLWKLLAETYGAEGIFERVFVINHCPLLLLDEGGKNLTPDKLSGPSTRALLKACDAHLAEVVEALGATKIIGVGKYAEGRAKLALPDYQQNGLEITSVWHPSPASPLANRNGGADWRANVRAQLP